MARKDNRPYSFHCTKETPYRGHGLRDDVPILHQTAYTTPHGQRVCKYCNTNLGRDYERAWQREERLAAARKEKAETAGGRNLLSKTAANSRKSTEAASEPS